MGRTYRVGTRASPLAVKQAEEAIALLRVSHPDAEFEIVRIETDGDKDKITPISGIEGSDFFTRQIDSALLKGDIDFAVHSAKDLPDPVPEGLMIAAITKCVDPYDALVSKGNLKIHELPICARIGASSRRRKEQLKAYRDDFKIVDIRGTIEERLALLDQYPIQTLDAIVIAVCALVRLGLEHRITQKISTDILKPHPLQGSLAIVTRRAQRKAALV